MMPIVVFNFAQLLASGYALWRGGAPERVVAVLLVAAAAASAAFTLDTAISYRAVEWWLLGVDVSLFVTLCMVACLANRYWPIWLSAVQLLTLATHGVRAFDSRIWALSYWLVSSYSAYVIIALLAIGTARHRRRLAAGMLEAGWHWPTRGNRGPAESGPG